MESVLGLVERVAPTDSTVLIQEETGTARVDRLRDSHARAFFRACDQTLPISDPDHATLRAKNADHAFTASHESLLGLA
jgi:hypothetical protein